MPDEGHSISDEERCLLCNPEGEKGEKRREIKRGFRKYSEPVSVTVASPTAHGVLRGICRW